MSKSKPLSVEVKINRLQVWISALRSGHFKQCRYSLHDTVGEAHCCIGVGAIVSGNMHNHYEGAQEYYDYTNIDEHKLMDLNDRQEAQFPVIADWIELNLLTPLLETKTHA